MVQEIAAFLLSNRFLTPLIIIISAVVIYNLSTIILTKIMGRGRSELEKKRLNTVLQLINSIIKYIVVIVTIIMILNIYKINTGSLLAGLGIAGIVIGFALQDAIKDVIGGMNIVLENYFILGDTVKYNDFTGTIIEFGLKSTKIKANNGEVLVLSNRCIDRIINLSQKQAVITIEIPTSPEHDAKKIQKTLEKVIDRVRKLADVDAEGCYYSGIDRLDGKAVVYTFKVKCKQGKQSEIKRAVLGMVKEAYEKESLKLF